jgi:anti-sigma factor RsiW
MSYVDFPCQKAVTLLTEYMEGALDTEERAVLERHLAWCDWCMTYVDQLRQAIRTAHSLRDDEAPQTPAAVDDLITVFRSRGGS